MEDRPHPYLTREETDLILGDLGFQFEDNGLLVDNPRQRHKFTLLMQLIAGAIADWADVEPEPGATTYASINEELNTFVQEYLVG